MNGSDTTNPVTSETLNAMPMNSVSSVYMGFWFGIPAKPCAGSMSSLRISWWKANAAAVAIARKRTE